MNAVVTGLRVTWVFLVALSAAAGCSENEPTGSCPDACTCSCSDASSPCDADVDADVDVGTEPDTDLDHDVETDADPDAETPVTCGPVRHFTYPLDAPVTLSCGAASSTTVFDVAVPAEGQALARAALVVRHRGTAVSPVIHFWNASVLVGAPELAYGIGDDLCPGRTVTRTNLGYGRFDATTDHVRVQAYQGSSPCTDGTLSIEPGSTLDVWVESPEPECRERDIRVRSFYEMVDTDTRVHWVWPTLMAEVLSLRVESFEPTERLRVLAVIEGTPWDNPNATCGAEAATLVLQTALDGAILSTVREVVPASSGMGHLVLSADAEVEVSPGSHEAALLAGSNFDRYVTTGGCCGDATLAVVRVP